MYDMDEIEIQRKIMDSIESKELREEKARWHKKYNEAENEIAIRKREIDSLVDAIHTLIKERDTAMSQRHIRYIGRHWSGITWHDPNRIPKSDKTLWSTQKSILIGYIRQLQKMLEEKK